MPRRRKSRIRTSTESSVEIQVTEEQRIVTTTTCSASFSPSGSSPFSTIQDSLVVPKSGFLELLRTVGAQGETTQDGEVFELRNLSNYLKEYVKLRQLWDVNDQMTISCKDDPLSKVFGVSQFSLKDVRELLLKSSLPFHNVSAIGDKNNSMTVREGNSQWNLRMGNDGIPKEPSLSGGPTNKRKRRKKRKNTSSSGSSESKRGRRSSISILYSDAEGSSTSYYPYLVQFHVEESDSDDVLSIQSKTTAVVSDSSDDFWFLEEDVTVEVVELKSENEDPPFDEEYEVDSETSIVAEENDLSNESTDEESEAPTQPDVDMEFWADSESSDSETDGTDVELSDLDKWFCKNCNWRNLPIHRNCNRCWDVRDGWLPEGKDKTPEVTAEEIGGLYAKNTKANEDRFYSSSDNEAAKYYYQSERKDNHISNSADSPHTSVTMLPNVAIKPSLNPANHLNLHSVKTAPNEISHCDKPETSTLSSLDKKAYPLAGTSAVCHTWTHATDKPIMTVSLQENDSEIGASQITSSQDSGLHDCSPQESFEDSFDTLDHVESSQSHTSSLSQVHEKTEVFNNFSYINKDGYVRLSPRSQLLKRKDSGIGSFSSAGTPATEEEKERSIEGHEDEECTTTQLTQVEKLKRKISHTFYSKPGTSESSDTTGLCSICLNGPKEASLIHGRTGHQVCCYHCAKRLYKRGQPCPVCRRRIQKVIRNYYV